MPVKTIQLPNGTTRKIQVPEGATNEEILGFVESQWEAGAFDRPEEVFATPKAPQATQQLTPEQTLAAQQQVQQQGVVNEEPALGFSPQIADDLAAYVRSELPVEGDPIKDYFSSIEGAVKKRSGEVSQSVEDFKKGEITAQELALQAVGKGVAGTAADIAGETFMAGAKALTPDFIESRVAEVAAKAAEGVMSSEEWKFIEDNWKSLSPRTRKNLESAFNIGFGASALAGKAPLQGTGKKMSLKAMAMKRDRIAKQVLPDTTTARTSRNLTAKGAAEDRMLNTLMTVKGINHTKAPSENFKLVLKELDNIDDTMTKALKKYQGAGFPRNAIRSRVEKVLNDLKATDPVVFTDDSLSSLYQKMDRLLFEPKIGYIKDVMKPVDILKARRSLDKALKTLGKGGTDQSKLFIEAGAQGQIIRAYRDALNQIVDSSAKGLGIDTKALRSRSSDLLMARQNYARLAEPKERAIMEAIDRHPIAASAIVGGGSSTLAALLAARGVMKKGYDVVPNALQTTGNILQSPVGAAPAASLFYTDKENQQ